jgi:putative alpha-1,2-mannosidase
MDPGDPGNPGNPGDPGNPGNPGGGGPPAKVVPIDHVDPFIGTDDSSSSSPVPGGAGGSTYPGAVVPFGMVQISPDTPTASPSGYRYGDGQISQFSLTHFDGAGCPNNTDLPFLPVPAAVTASPAANWAAFRVEYDKATEKASPGFYHVKLLNGVEVDLTATTRTGMAKIQYPAGSPASFVLHAGRSATGNRGGSVEIVGTDRIRGSAMAGGFCGSSMTYTIFFAAQFDTPFSTSGTWLGNSLTPASTTASGVRAGAFASFGKTTVQVKIGLSFVSIENAEANLAAENPGWDFNAIRTAAATQWNKTLSRIEVSGGSDADLKKFYTALYHVFQSPNVASDVNGQYMGFDGVVHTADWTVYQNYSGWDIIRSWTHLVSAIAPEAPDIIRSMVNDGAQGGLLPFWTQQSVETHVMVGDPGTVNVANAYAMGVRGFDTATALALMLKSATDPNPDNTQRGDLANWLSLHYVDNGAVTLEYAMADFAISQFAGALGDTATRDAFTLRGDYWKNGWNPADGLIEPRVTAPSPGANAARIYEVQVFSPDAPNVNIAMGGTATASAMCNANENPSKAINGTWTGGNADKWCDNSSAMKWWQLDLGAAKDIGTVVIFHAGAGGELTDWNTQDFTLSVSNDGTTFTVVDTVTANTSDVTTHKLNAVNARFLRLDIVHAIHTGTIGDYMCQPLDVASNCGFIEGNAAQYVWMVPQNMEGLFTMMGGHDTAIARLDMLFRQLNAGINRPYFYIGNEPEHGTPWTYNFAQAPWKTQSTVRRVVDEAFTTNAGGLPGNDDLGATSSWLVWAYLGMYPMIPGTDVLVLHGPQFASIALHLANGNTVTIEGAGGGAPGAHFIQGLNVNGTATTRSWLRFSDIAGGAKLQFKMSTTANQSWGSAAADVPPSFAAPTP